MSAPITHEETARAFLRAAGRCAYRHCQARALETVRRHPMGGWARFDFTSGVWINAKGERVSTYEIEMAKDERVELRAVRVPEFAPSFYAGRVLALCQLCEAHLCQQPEPQQPVQTGLPL